MGQLVELNHIIEHGLAAYPGLPGVKIQALYDHQASRALYRDQAEFFIGRIEMSFNTGTCLNSPFHRHRHLEDLSQIPLQRVAGLKGVVVEAPFSDRRQAKRAIDIALPAEKLRGRAVLFRTGWDRHWGKEAYVQSGPYLSATTLEALIQARAVLVGVDFLNVDDLADTSRPAHTRLLDAGILIVENLTNLQALPLEGFLFSAVPLRIKMGASFPVRAFAEITAGSKSE